MASEEEQPENRYNPNEEPEKNAPPPTSSAGEAESGNTEQSGEAQPPVPLKPGKLYYTIGEVAGYLGVKQSLLRFWEKEFQQLKVKKNRKGNRLYTEKDIEELQLIYHLVREKKYTLDGAREALRARRKNVSQEMEIIGHLEEVRSFLQRLRQKLDDDPAVWQEQRPPGEQPPS
jgi:DNA-binding transcriptional MerR regulator